MSYRLSKIYTKTGDDGTTSIGPGQRLSKNHPRLGLLGTLDELNSALGLAIVSEQDNNLKSVLLEIQQDLFNLGGELCPPFHNVINAAKVMALEEHIDEWNKNLPPLKEFILPGGNHASAACHLARAICRRAERCAVTLYQSEKFNPEILRYLNRLSDLLFVAARMMTRETNSAEILWNHERHKGESHD